jgi:PAS domain S-box-containing protein
LDRKGSAKEDLVGESDASRRGVREPAGEPRSVTRDAADLYFLVDAMAHGLVYQDADGRIVDCNTAAERILGLTRDQMAGRTHLDPRWRAIHEDGSDYPGETHPAMEALRTGKPESGVMGVFHPAAEEYRWIIVHAVPRFVLGVTKPVGVYTTFEDITERRRVEEALRESERGTRAIIESAPFGMHIYRLETDGRLVFVGANPAADRILGVDNGVYVGKTIEEAFPPLRETEVPARYREAAATGVPWSTVQIDYHDGVIRGAFEVHAFRAAQGVVVAAFVDITERKRAEEARNASEARYRLLAENVQDVVWTMTLDGRFSYVSPSVTTQTGFTPEEYYALTVDRILTPESAARVAAVLGRELAKPPEGRLASIVLEVQEYTKDGPPIDIEVNAAWMHAEDGTPTGVIGISRNITERMRVQEERTLNALRLAALLELNQMAGASIHDLTHFAMEEAVRLTRSTIGYVAFASEDESVLTMHAWSTAATAECAIEDKPLVYPVATTGLWGEAIRQRRPILTNDYAADNPWKRGVPAGHVRVARHMNVPVFDGDRIVIVAGVGNKAEDYDEGDVRQLTLLMEGMWRILVRRRAEEARAVLEAQLAQAAKMEAVGRLAGGVAHDFNNLLTTILGYSEMIVGRLVPGDPLRDDIEEVRKAGERAASLTEQLLAFSRKQVIKRRIVDLNAVVNESRKMIGRLIGENITLAFDLAADLGCVKVDPHQIDQALLNLAVNARDAMADGGTLTVATANATLDADFVRANPGVAPGEYVALSVADTGVGLSDETKARLFEPFFTTKEQGKGTGLGLAMVYGIVKQNGGTISVYSELGRGAVFRLYFPRTDEAPTPPVDATRAAAPTGSETVLLVEDDAMVRRLARRVLDRLGYAVLEADGVDDAVRICATHRAPIHLLLTDIVMPGMNGVELHARLKAARPDMNALFMSGYAEDAIARHGVLAEGADFIQKPFSVDDLAASVRRALDRSAG